MLGRRRAPLLQERFFFLEQIYSSFKPHDFRIETCETGENDFRARIAIPGIRPFIATQSHNQHACCTADYGNPRDKIIAPPKKRHAASTSA
jgi:hypothetical protein